MQLMMNDRQLQTVEQVRQFLEGSEAVEFRGLTIEGKYNWIQEVLIRFEYHFLKRDEKGVIGNSCLHDFRESNYLANFQIYLVNLSLQPDCQPDCPGYLHIVVNLIQR